MTRVAILGSSGYLGSFLVQSLKEKFKIISHSRNKIKDKNFNKKIYKEVLGDIKKDKTINDILKQKPDCIIYTISLNHIDSEKNIFKSLESNFLPFNNLIQKIKKKKYKTKVIYLSTMQVYGREYNQKIINENYPKNFDNIYALTHSMCEDLLNTYRKTIDFHCLRISNTFGMPVLKNINCWWLVINDFCQSSIKNNKIVINSDGTALRDFVTLETLSKVISKLINTKKAFPFVNVCSGKTFSIKEIAHKISKNSFFKNKVKVEIKKKAKIKKKKFLYSTENLRKLSIKPFLDFDLNITQFLKCLKNQ